jgi:hydroxylamine reductase
MFCFQCQESFKNSGCRDRGVCGKPELTANLQDLLVFALKGLAFYAVKLRDLDGHKQEDTDFLVESLFSTITNASWDDDDFENRIAEALNRRDILRVKLAAAGVRTVAGGFPDCATWRGERNEFAAKAVTVGILSCEDEDVRSLRELLVTALKGIAAYIKHASALGRQDLAVDDFLLEALASTTSDLTLDEMLGWIMRAGEISVAAMALLDQANTDAYGHPRATQIDIGVGKRPGILVSGHDLRDLSELLEQSADSGVDIYTHGEMLPAHSYPALKRHSHLVGNYGNAWWEQNSEFESFHGPILLTTNCLVPPKPENTYLQRLYTTGAVRMKGATHIPAATAGPKDFSALIEQAKSCPPPKEIETGSITGGFAHDQILSLTKEILDAVQTGALRRFVVMAGCDGRHKSRSYYTEVAEQLPRDTVILTAGCAKFRYNKLDLGDIGGIPRVLDAGQCNDSYSLALVALRLKEALGLADINDLPITYDIAWYEQKAVAVLLALLHLGVKGIRLGPTLPAFLSPNVAKLLIERFDLKTIDTPESAVLEMLAA